MTIATGAGVAVPVFGEICAVGCVTAIPVEGAGVGVVAAAIGAEAEPEVAPLFRAVFIAIIVFVMPPRTAAMAAWCDATALGFAASVALNEASAETKAPSELESAARSDAESVAFTVGVLCVTGVIMGATEVVAAPVPAVGDIVVPGNPVSPCGTMPAFVSRFTRVARITWSSCIIVAVLTDPAGDDVVVIVCAWTKPIFDPKLIIASAIAAKTNSFFIE